MTVVSPSTLSSTSSHSISAHQGVYDTHQSEPYPTDMQNTISKTSGQIDKMSQPLTLFPSKLSIKKTEKERLSDSIGVPNIIACSIGRDPKEEISPPTGGRILSPASPETTVGSVSSEVVPPTRSPLSSSSLFTILSSSTLSSSLSTMSSSLVSSQQWNLTDGYISKDFHKLLKIYLSQRTSTQEIATELATLYETYIYPVSGVELDMGALVYYHLWKMHRRTRFRYVKEEELPLHVEKEYTLKAFLNKGDKYTSTLDERNKAIGRAYLEALIFGLEKAIASGDRKRIKIFYSQLEEAQMSFEPLPIYNFLNKRSNDLGKDITRFKKNLRKAWNL